MIRSGVRARPIVAGLAVLLIGTALVPAGSAGAATVPCGPVTAVAPRYIAESSIRDGQFDFSDQWAGGNLPPEDKFLFWHQGRREGGRLREGFGYHHVDAMGSDDYPVGAQGTHFRVVDPFAGFATWFSVVPRTEETDSRGSYEDGLFIRRIEIARRGARRGADRLQFSPVTAETSGGLRVLDFPIREGERFDDIALDIAAKGTSVGSIGAQSANVIESSVDVGAKEIVPVCDQLTQAWKVSMTIRSTGEYNWTLTGAFWLATYMGGWPIKEEFSFESHDDKLISGSFSSNLARLEPGDYI